PKCTDAVSDAKRALIRQRFCLYFHPVHGSGENQKRTVAALACFLAKILRKLKQFSKLSSSHHFHDSLVILLPFFLISIRAVFFQPVGQISACHNDCSSSKPYGCLLNVLS